MDSDQYLPLDKLLYIKCNLTEKGCDGLQLKNENLKLKRKGGKKCT